MAADALAPYVAIISHYIIMHNKQFLVFYEEGFQLPAPNQFWKLIEKANIVLCIPTKNQCGID